MKVGDEYSCYEDFEEALKVYKNSVCNEYWIRDARTIQNQKKRFPDTVDQVNESLRYYYIRLACVKGGRPFKSKNEKSLRKCTTLKQDCEATIFLRLSPSQKSLIVLELNDKHNHLSLKSYSNCHSQQRLKAQAKAYLKAGANKKIVLDQIQQQTGCKITLKDLTNLSLRTEKKSFAECVDLLKNIYKCSSVHVCVDENDVFNGLFFQDERMKKYFEAFPEMLFVDGTYCLVDLKIGTYIIMVENGNGLSEIVAVCLLVDENEETFDFFIETFKKCNPAWTNVQVVMSDKDRTERKVFAKYFPNTKLIICLFHVLQIFNREITVKKMNITTSEVQESKTFLQKLTYAESELEYNTIYKEMIAKVPEIVKQYYESNWAPITNQWIKYLTSQNLCLSNTTNNRLENLNSNLKNVINRYSPLEDFIKNLFVYINSFRAGQDVTVSQMLNKRLAKPYKAGSVEALYCQLLTMFAYENVEKQLKLSESCNDLKHIEGATFLAISTEGWLKVSPLDCECMFRKSNQLPCRHIFKCRQLLSLPLYESSLCLNRWTRQYSEDILQVCENNYSNNFEMTISTEEIPVKVTNANLPKALTRHQKFKMIDDQGKIMAKLCSKVSTPIFNQRFEFIQNVIKHWSEGNDSVIKNIFSKTTSEVTEIIQVPDKKPRKNSSFLISQEVIVQIREEIKQEQEEPDEQIIEEQVDEEQMIEDQVSEQQVLEEQVSQEQSLDELFSI